MEPGRMCDEDNEAKTRSSSSAYTPLPNSLFVANLSGLVTEKELKEFFKDVGQIIGIKFATFNDGSSKGFARVQFASSEAVEKACMLNGCPLMGQRVRLNFGHEQRMINPESISTFKKPDDFSKNTVLIKGFDSAYDVNLMAGFLKVHFDECKCADGGFTRISVQKDKVSGASAGVAFMEFSHPNCMPIALRQDGTVPRGFRLQVEEAKHVEGAEPSSTLPDCP